MKVFLTVWAGQLVSLLGSGLTNFGLGIWVFQKTGSATLFATIALLAILPGLVVSPFAGVLVDRWDRRLVMLGSDLLSAVCVGLVALVVFSGNLQVGHVMVLAGVTSALGAFQVPAYQASVSSLVPKEQLGRAAGMVQMGQAVADLAAPILAGFMFVAIGLNGLMVLDFFSFFFGILTLAFVRFPRIAKAETAGGATPNFRSEFAQGWDFIVKRPGLLLLLGYFAALNFLLPLAGVLFAPLILSFASPQQFGSVISILGLGMLAGSILMSVWGGPKNRVVGVVASGMLIGLFLAGSGLQANVTLVAVCGFLMMFASPVTNGASQVIWQAKTPLELQGRVFSVRRMIAQGTAPIAMLISGPLVDRVFGPAMMPGGSLAPVLGPFIGVGAGRGVGLLFVLMGSLTVVVSIACLASPAMRKIESTLPDAPVELAEA